MARALRAWAINRGGKNSVRNLRYGPRTRLVRSIDGANKMQIDNTELFLKLFHIQCKEIGNNKYYEETTELEKWQSEILPEY